MSRWALASSTIAAPRVEQGLALVQSEIESPRDLAMARVPSSSEPRRPARDTKARPKDVVVESAWDAGNVTQAIVENSDLAPAPRVATVWLVHSVNARLTTTTTVPRGTMVVRAR